MTFPNAAGNERRDVFDLHVTGKTNGFDYDFEAMNQTGSIGADAIEAWAFGSLAGYTFSNVNWKPRLGMQIDAASGDRGVPPATRSARSIPFFRTVTM